MIFVNKLILFSVLTAFSGLLFGSEPKSPHLDSISLKFSLGTTADRAVVTLSTLPGSENFLEILYKDKRWYFKKTQLSQYPDLDPTSLRAFTENVNGSPTAFLCVAYGEYYKVKRFDKYVWSKNWLEIEFDENSLSRKAILVKNQRLPSSVCTINEDLVFFVE